MLCHDTGRTGLQELLNVVSLVDKGLCNSHGCKDGILDVFCQSADRVSLAQGNACSGHFLNSADGSEEKSCFSYRAEGGRQGVLVNDAHKGDTFGLPR